MTLHSSDGGRTTRCVLIARIIHECHASNAVTGRVAEIFCGISIPYEEAPSAEDIADAIGLDVWDAAAHTLGVKHIAQRVLEQHLVAVRASPGTDL